jgi:hypothetical protein
MLKKLTEPEVTKEAPFANDVLNRNASIERLTNLVKSTEQPFVLSVEAPWGWGKTTFIRMWKAHLESKGHTCLLFNAWQNDFVDDPLVAFIGEITKLIEKEKQELNEDGPIKQYLGEVKKVGAGVLRKALPVLVKVATQGVLDTDTIKNVTGALAGQKSEVADFASELAKERLEKYEKEITGIEAFRVNLEKLTQAIVSKAGASSPLVFFVDELDRCRPDFAIALLERIKHLFNVQRVVFVLSIDRAQLNESVKALYGLNTNPDGYLRRFIDLGYSLPPPTAKNFVESLYARFAMDEVFNQINNGHDSATAWRTSFAECAGILGLSLREQEQCFIEMNIAWRTGSRHFEIFPIIISLYSALRARNPKIFQKPREREETVEDYKLLFSDIRNLWYRVWYEVGLIYAFCADKQERDQRFKQLKLLVDEPRHEHMCNMYNVDALLENLSHDRYRSHFSGIISLLEMSDQFR